VADSPAKVDWRRVGSRLGFLAAWLGLRVRDGVFATGVFLACGVLVPFGAAYLIYEYFADEFERERERYGKRRSRRVACDE